MADDIVQIIENARVDATSLSEFIYYPATVTVNRRLTPPIHTLNYYLQYLEGLEKVYSQPTGTVDVNGEVVKTVRQSINDAIDSAILGDYQSTLELELAQEVIRATDAEGVISQDLSDLSLEVEYQKLDTGIISTSKNGTLPIAQAVKNAQTIGLVEYGATGDGITDDTAAFELLEVNVISRAIDLQGKTYSVAKTPYKNQYVNGSFKVSGTIIPSNKDAFSTLATDFPLIPAVNDGMSGLMWDWYLTSTSVAGMDSNAVQSFALDEVNQLIYAMYDTGTYDGSAVLYAIPMNKGTSFNTAVWAADADRRLGHQGLGVENNKDGYVYIWATKRNNTGLPETTDINSGCKVIRFRVDNVPNYSTAGGAVNEWEGRNGVYFEGVQDYQLWETLITDQNAQACLSHDQRYLLTKMNVPDGYRIRVFELETLVAGGAGDYSDKFIHEFTVPTEAADSAKGVGIQDIACDGKFIYFYAGRNDISEGSKILLVVYDMLGNHVSSTYTGNIGLYDSLNYKGDATTTNTISETEGITIGTINGKPQVLIHFASGSGGKRPSLIYSLGLKQGNFRGDRNTPALVTANYQGGLSYATPRKQTGKFGVVDASTQITNIQFSEDRVVLGSNSEGLPVLSLQLVGRAAVSIDESLSMHRIDDSSAPFRHTVFKSRAIDVTTSMQKAVQSGDYLYELNITADDGSQTLVSSNVGASAAAITFRCSGAVSTGNIPTSMFVSTSGASGGKTFRWKFADEGHFSPEANNAYDVGASNRSIRNIYLQASPVIASDERLKQDFRKLMVAEKKAALEIKEAIYLYKMRDGVVEKGDGARWHVGVKAQEIVSIMESHKLKPFDYGFICHDEWDAEEAELDEDGGILQEAREAGDKYAVRYDELTMFILAAI